mgnify:CR=1 FL=1
MRIQGLSQPLRGVTTVPGDKSVSHRAIMLGALASGRTIIEGFLPGADCLATIHCFRLMGVDIRQENSRVAVEGVGLRGLKSPDTVLDVGNSGTTIRLLMGILAGQHFAATLTGDASIRQRPMGRVAEPLRLMGADIESDRAPVTVRPVHSLKGIHYQLPVASAQVKSALLLAGLYADGVTSVTELAPSRDHTEIMLTAFGVPIRRSGLTVAMESGHSLRGRTIMVPGDISSAAFLIVAALIVPDSDIILQGVGVNPTRTGIIDVLQKMGGDIEVRTRTMQDAEAVADIRVRYSQLRGIEVAGDIIPRLIDEIPALAVAAAFASGETTIRDAAELKVKESNRIAAMVNGLRAMGADASEQEDGLSVRGGKPLTGVTLDSNNDHRIAMALAVAGLAAAGPTVVAGEECIPVSFPGFAEILCSLGADAVMGV